MVSTERCSRLRSPPRYQRPTIHGLRLTKHFVAARHWRARPRSPRCFASAGSIRCGVEVTSVRRIPGRLGFRVETSQGTVEADNVVAATGAFQLPVVPEIIPARAGLSQIHSSTYRNPGQAPEGAVLIVGAGSSGVQIADELLQAGRRVFLSVGPHDRPPRAYRGLDYVWWLGVLGKWDAQSRAPGTEHVTIAVSGANGGETIDFRRLGAKGITLVGQTQAYENGILTFASDLVDNIERGDANYLSLLDEADAYIARNGLNLPEEPDARKFAADPPSVKNPILALNLKRDGVSTVIWATGYTCDYGWLQADAFDEKGNPNHQRGVSSEPGVYFLGLPWLSGRGSSFIWGVWHDAKYIADHIVTRKRYLDYHFSKQRKSAPRRSALKSDALVETR